ncbi:uncharacterized protein LY89DRAFT_776560 [Mollisia scopiformis]|uniref:Protein kinase domain-containing protein n=1 Tax=Mollisia scopiformis TaxID=149040 RepID=A0A194XVU7_MOLSC|nr:uncharacterized protein LY89DRAFT_776560 [Mollisia scopiformis]KUJ24440.1 hypothetical protein LY89DRAFT_776560 [Mollisia scopiformis]
MSSSHETIISNEISRYNPRRSQRYSTVHVLLIRWKDDDIGVADEVKQLAQLFRDKFNFFVWPYQIPTENSQVELYLHIAQFIQRCGSENDNLIILHYSGHGGRTADLMNSECVWSAKISGGPTVDWAIIQPGILGAGCDVAILLDCCFAGQAVRSRFQHNVEFLAATDKDQFTPTGNLANRPSFTKVLIELLDLVAAESSNITILELHRQMLRKEAGLVKQPFYASLSRSSSVAGIRLARWEPLDATVVKAVSSTPSDREDSVSLYLRLSLFQPMDMEQREALIRWLTRDSPSDIEHIQILQRTISEAQAVGQVSSEILCPKIVAPNVPPQLRISDDTREEAKRLTRSLTHVLSIPETYQFADLDVRQIIKSISERSDQLLAFMNDCIAGLNEESLDTFRNQDLYGTFELESRIAMRLTLVQDEVMKGAIKLYLDNTTLTDQRLRIGRKEEDSVLVEYWEYETMGNEDVSKSRDQAARISALLIEDKAKAFRILPGLGYVEETIRPRIGFVYRLPSGISTDDYWTLSELIGTVKALPLEVRFQLASTICDAILHLHSIGWFHKAIKSENIIILRNLHNTLREASSHKFYDFDNPYVIGFDCSRPSQTESRLTVDFSVKNNIYRHPERWGTPKPFERKHDIYALGILLLEIGCWRPLPSMDGSRKGFESVKKPERLRDTLLEIVRTKLAHSAGSKYCEAVAFCLEEREWTTEEPWQTQRRVRQKVWQPLKMSI